MRSSSLRDARRAGEKMTISHLAASASAATNMAMEKVLPKRRGVAMSTSEEVEAQPRRRMMSGACAAKSSR